MTKLPITMNVSSAVAHCCELQCFHLSLKTFFVCNFQLALFSFQVKTELTTSIEEGKGEVKIVPETLH